MPVSCPSWVMYPFACLVPPLLPVQVALLNTHSSPSQPRLLLSISGGPLPRLCIEGAAEMLDNLNLAACVVFGTPLRSLSFFTWLVFHAPHGSHPSSSTWLILSSSDMVQRHPILLRWIAIIPHHHNLFLLSILDLNLGNVATGHHDQAHEPPNHIHLYAPRRAADPAILHFRRCGVHC